MVKGIRMGGGLGGIPTVSALQTQDPSSKNVQVPFVGHLPKEPIVDIDR